MSAEGSESVFVAHHVVAHDGEVVSASVGPKSASIFASGGNAEDRRVNVWRLGREAPIWSLVGHSSSVVCLGFDADERLLASGSEGGSLKVFDLYEGRLARSLKGHMSTLHAVAYHPYGDFIASGSRDTNVKVWDVRQRQCIQTYKGHSADVNCVAFSPDGKWVASGGADGKLILWDLVGGKQLQTLYSHGEDSSGEIGSIDDIAFNPNEFLIAAATDAKVLKLWDLEAFDLVATAPSDPSQLRKVCFDAVGDAVFGVGGSQIRGWEWEPLGSLGSAEARWGNVQSVTASQEDQLLVASTMGASVTIYGVDLRELHRNRHRPLPSLSSAQRIKTPTSSSAQCQSAAGNEHLGLGVVGQRVEPRLSGGASTAAGSQESLGEAPSVTRDTRATQATGPAEPTEAKSEWKLGDKEAAVAAVVETHSASGKHRSVATEIGQSFKMLKLDNPPKKDLGRVVEEEAAGKVVELDVARDEVYENERKTVLALGHLLPESKWKGSPRQRKKGLEYGFVSDRVLDDSTAAQAKEAAGGCDASAKAPKSVVDGVASDRIVDASPIVALAQRPESSPDGSLRQSHEDRLLRAFLNPKPRSNAMSVLNYKLANLRLLRTHWSNPSGGPNACFEHLREVCGLGLRSVRDEEVAMALSVTATFLNSIPLRKCNGLKLGDGVLLLPLLRLLLTPPAVPRSVGIEKEGRASAPPVWLTAAAKTLLDLLLMFGGIIGGNRRLPSSGSRLGIDFAAQERQEKAASAHEAIKELWRSIREAAEGKTLNEPLSEILASLRSEVGKL